MATAQVWDVTSVRTYGISRNIAQRVFLHMYANIPSFFAITSIFDALFCVDAIYLVSP